MKFEAESVDAELDGCVVVVMMMGVELFVSTIKPNGMTLLPAEIYAHSSYLYTVQYCRNNDEFLHIKSAAAEAKQSKRRYRNEQRKHQINTNEAVLCMVN